jgi:hypothetical protein
MTVLPASHLAAPVANELDDLITRLLPLANAVNDNAWDHSQPLSRRTADAWLRQLRSAINAIDNATGAPSLEGFSLPSMSGKELV